MELPFPFFPGMFCQATCHREMVVIVDFPNYLGVSSIFILSRNPELSRKPSETQANGDRLLKRTMVEKNGESIPRAEVLALCALFGSVFAGHQEETNHLGGASI